MPEEPKKNVFRCETLINNWYEERAIREAIIEGYLVKKQQSDQKAALLAAEQHNLTAPVALTKGKLVCNNDNLLVINHNQRPLSISVDPRYTSREYESAFITSLSAEIGAGNRHVFTIERVKSLVQNKFGTRSDMQQTDDPCIRFGERFILTAQQSMIDFLKNGKFAGQKFVLGCPKTMTGGQCPLILGQYKELGFAAEFMLEPFQASERLEKQGQTVHYDDIVLLRHCASGQCIGSHPDGPKKEIMDFKIEEFQVQCKSYLNVHKHEDQCNCITLTVGGDGDEE
ncbi:hypothetical protein SS50377_27159 [Spironucleus salmonicida]|uniref:Uncharacterized protein n=1 Tax=Spironucleus salmonicida TaxID=348837 RepID=V6LHR4_9EUKA|nr:hypothetical protein SS50377_27159 [Spironucleus salmonicida]|eukprot:EST43843.1 hypothetical protein SS50377_16387 [Spironucleus salmonicida]